MENIAIKKRWYSLKSLNTQSDDIVSSFVKTIKGLNDINLEAEVQIKERQDEMEQLAKETEILFVLKNKNARIAEKLNVLFEVEATEEPVLEEITDDKDRDIPNE